MECVVSEFHEVGLELIKHLPTFERDANLGESINVDWESLQFYSARGLCPVVTLRDGQEIAACAMFLVHRPILHKHLLSAQQAALYVAPKHRGRVLGALIECSEAALRERGVQEVTHTLENARVGRALERYGYKETERKWGKKWAV
jgi:GNAT superfamily N-acetyltransferase